MYKDIKVKTTALMLSMVLLSACSTVTKMTIREHDANGKKVSMGQFEPTAEYGCTVKETAKQSWGVKGFFMPGSARDSLDEEVMKKAPGIDANYVYLDIPAQVYVAGIPVSMFKDATATYYSCTKVPA